MPDDPIAAAAGEGSHPVHGRDELQLGLSIWPGVVGGERYVQALPRL